MRQEINYVVNGETWTKAQDEAFKKLNKKAKIDGFRPGKAPRSMYEKNYGVQSIYSEAMNTLLDEKYKSIITEEKIFPIIEPIINIVKIDEKELEVNIVLVTEPEVTLGEYKNLKVKKEKVKVTKEEVEHEIHHLVENYAELVTKEGKVENGNIAIIDFEGFKDGVAFEGGKGENYSLEIGSHTFIPGFEEAIVGMKKDEEKDINLKFPEDYASEELKGQEVVFKVKVNDIKERQLPEFDKEFFEDLNIPGVTTKEELDKQIEAEIKEQKERNAENKYIDDLVDKASNNMKIELAKELINVESEAMFEDFMKRITAQGIPEEMYFQYTGTTKEDVVTKMNDEAEKRLKARYLLQEIIKVENLDATDEEIDKDINEIKEHYGMTEEEVLKEIGGREYIKMNIMFKKAIDVLKTTEK
jgi:trigger factor